MVGVKSRYIVAGEPKAEKCKTFGTLSTITTEANQDDDQVKHGAAAINGATADHETTTPLELGDLMAKLDQIDKKLECSEEDREVIKKEIRYNTNEYLDNYFNLARETEEKLQQMSDKVEAVDRNREKKIKKDMQEMKQRYDTVNSKLGSLETRMDTMSRDQAESSCAIQSKLDAILRNSITQDNLVTTRTQGNIRTRFRGTTTEQTGVNTVTVNPGCSKHSTGGGGQDNYEEWKRKYNEWSRRFHDEQ